jgi:hypothetical protein|tara:strand:+ start:172 stop:555 length:384 start_codon:yes stop_codon:yes gene_type:complete
MAKEQFNTFTGGQKGLTTVGDHAYAFSGSVAYDNTETTALEFQTGKWYVVATAHIEYVGTSGDDLTTKMYLNNVQVWETYLPSGTAAVEAFPVDFVIPHNTTLKLTFTNQDDTIQNAFAILKGRVYS